MNKKIIAAFIAVLLALPISAANAASLKNKTISEPTLAILDTAIDMSLPIFKDRVVYEACVIQWASCPNGRAVMEGPGSAVMPANFISQNGFGHGTQMASLAIQANPNIKIVFVRIVGANSKGFRQATGEPTTYNALQWVIDNKDRLNIQAVSMSQGHANYSKLGNYCPVTPSTENRINLLMNAGVPVFFPTGNGSDYSRINWPACIPSSIAVGATMPNNEIAFYSNFDPMLTDFFALGTTRAVTAGGQTINVAGTSASTAIAAAQWIAIKSAKPHLTYTEIYELISKTSIPTKNSKISNGKLINLAGALNG